MVMTAAVGACEAKIRLPEFLRGIGASERRPAKKVAATALLKKQ
jgi:hypothetical protein